MMVTGELAEGFMREQIMPLFKKVRGLEAELVAAPNVLFGRNVTVAGLLSGKCLYSALHGKDCGDLLLLPPDILNADALFLDDTTVPLLAEKLAVEVKVFDGRWADVFTSLKNKSRSH